MKHIPDIVLGPGGIAAGEKAKVSALTVCVCVVRRKNFKTGKMITKISSSNQSVLSFTCGPQPTRSQTAAWPGLGLISGSALVLDLGNHSPL